MYHKVMMQIYLPEDVCKKLYKKNCIYKLYLLKKLQRKSLPEKKNLLSIGNVTDSQNGKLLPCPKSFVTFPPGARALTSQPPLILATAVLTHMRAWERSAYWTREVPCLGRSYCINLSSDLASWKLNKLSCSIELMDGSSLHGRPGADAEHTVGHVGTNATRLSSRISVYDALKRKCLCMILHQIQIMLSGLHDGRKFHHERILLTQSNKLKPRTPS